MWLAKRSMKRPTKAAVENYTDPGNTVEHIRVGRALVAADESVERAKFHSWSGPRLKRCPPARIADAVGRFDRSLCNCYYSPSSIRSLWTSSPLAKEFRPSLLHSLWRTDRFRRRERDALGVECRRHLSEVGDRYKSGEVRLLRFVGSIG
jgi:hypothetical protein